MANYDSKMFLGGINLGVGVIKLAPRPPHGALGFSAILVELLAQRRTFGPGSQAVLHGNENSAMPSESSTVSS